MNRLVLIGNGFDLAHDLKTRYEDFFYWYWEQRRNGLVNEHTNVSEDILCKLKCFGYTTLSMALMYDTDLKYAEGKDVYEYIIKSDKIKKEYSPFFKRITKSLETKGWVDIENEYYDLLKQYVLKNNDLSEIENLNSQLHFLQDKLVEYLKSIEISDKLLNTGIRQKIYAPFEKADISIEGMDALKKHVEYGLKRDNRNLDAKFRQYGGNCYTSGFVDDYREKFGNLMLNEDELPKELLLPNQIMLLNFNYTQTARLYRKNGSIFTVNQIHGNLEKPSTVIFGYGDELDSDYKTIVDKNDNRILGNIKSIKYLEADNYRRMLSFIEAEPYQILIMGHSCGNSDRTLLNTLFEHKNCVSIKPYYHQIDKEHDDYIKIIQNISRNFTDMKLMRDRVVNKTYCEPLTIKNNN